MSVGRFEARAIVRIGGRKHIMLRQLEGEVWQLEDAATKRITEKTLTELRTLYGLEKLRFCVGEENAANDKELPPRIPNVSGAGLEKAKLHRAYAKAIEGLPRTKASIELAVKTVWARLKDPLKPPKPPHWFTVLRWRDKYARSGDDIASLLDDSAKKGNRSARVSETVIAIVENTIEDTYLTKEKKTVEDTLNIAQAKVRRENKLRPSSDLLVLPSFSLVKRMIDALPAYDRCAAREGKDVARKRFRSVLGHRVTDEPLERAEIDHTPMNLMVVDDRTWLPLGRPTLTACIDDNTRNVLGINIGFEPPNFLTVARCLKHALMPKEELRKLYPEVEGKWHAHGVMRELSMDNGAEFHSTSLEFACHSMGIEIHYSPRKQPWFKGKIERWMGTVNRETAHMAPGTTFSNIFEKGEYDPVKHAVIRLSTLKKLVAKWIVDVYHERKHRALGVCPRVMWTESIRPEDIGLPDDPRKLDAILGRRDDRSLTHKGIELDGLSYNSTDMEAMRLKLGPELRVDISIDDGDIGKIVVFMPDNSGEFFVVPALRVNYATGLSRFQHKVCKRYAAQRLGKTDPAGWQEAKLQIAEMIAKEFQLSPKGRKKSPSAKKTHSRTARYQEGSASTEPTEAVPEVHEEPRSPKQPAITKDKSVERKAEVSVQKVHAAQEKPRRNTGDAPSQAPRKKFKTSKSDRTIQQGEMSEA